MNNVIDFYDKLDLKYPEIAVTLEPFLRSSPGTVKFTIPILLPTMDLSKPIETQAHQFPTNIINEDKNAVNIQHLKVTNYIEMKFPEDVAKDCTEFMIPKDAKWLTVFVGGDITKPYPIRRYYEYVNPSIRKKGLLERIIDAVTDIFT